MAGEKLVKFVTGTSAEFALADKDANTLYFITDERRIYKGDTPYGGMSVLVVTELPESADPGVLYVNSNTGEVNFYNGTAYVQIVKPITASLGTTSTNNEIATAKAIYDFVKAEVAKVDAGGINETITNLENDLATLTTTVNGKADAATTLDGYGILDAYTKTETDTKIAEAVADASHLKREIVDELPAKEDADELTIYMVAKGTDLEKEGNVYDEYMYIPSSESFELIGSTEVDLTDYAKTADVTTAVSNAMTSITNAYEAADATILETAADYADGLADNYATAAQGAKADSAVQEVTIGATSGTISVDGTEIYVAGLGTAAFEKVAAFDEAGAADAALASAKSYVNNALSWQEL